jgi:hypothetical protein
MMPAMTLELISVHVPKCGGTSFCKALERAYSKDDVFFDYADRPLDPASPCNMDPDGFLDAQSASLASRVRGKRVAHGHFYIRKYDGVPADCARITFLRHPIDRLISHYYFWLSLRKDGHTLHNYVVDHRLTLLQFARLPLIRHMYTQVFFRDVEMRAFDFIGSIEHLADDTRKLEQVLGKRLEIGRVNTNNHRGYDEQRQGAVDDPRTLAALQDLLADDIRFYESSLALSRT